MEIYQISPFRFCETSFELENPRSQKEGRFRRVDKTFFPLGPGSTLGEACGFSGAHDAFVFNVFPSFNKHIMRVERKFFLCMRWHLLSCSKFPPRRVLRLKEREKFSCPPIPPLRGRRGYLESGCMLLDGWKFRCEALEDLRSLWNENEGVRATFLGKYYDWINLLFKLYGL